MEPENLIAAHDQHFQEALAEIAEKVSCERDAQINVVDFCKTFSKCGTTIIPEPPGVVHRVYTLVGMDYCDPVYYDEVDWPYPEFFGKFVMERMRTLPTFKSTLDYGVHPADASQDNPCGRARRGVWAKFRGNIIIAPWIQSTEVVVAEWDGVKNQWADADPVNESQAYKRAIRLYWQFLHEDNFGEKKTAMLIHDVGRQVGQGTYDRALADLMYECERVKKVRETAPNPIGSQWRCIPSIVERNGQPEPPPPPMLLCHLGNFVYGNYPEQVRQLVDNFLPNAILAAGVNAGGDLEGITYDQLVGSQYHDFIAPYYGDFGEASPTNRFWPAPGDGDWDENGLAGFHSFFATPKNADYYEVCLGPIHLFVLSMNGSEVDGITEDSPQGQWLKVKMSLSPAPWKIVLAHKLPDPIWPFKQWGATFVLTGRPYYERRNLSGLPVINNGAAGPQTAPAPGGDTVYVSDQITGAGFIVATRCSIRYSFVNLAGETIDSVEFHKLADCVDPADADAALIAPSPQLLASKCKRFYQSAGDPNGVVMAPSPAFCWDSVNLIVWKKTDGITSNRGWT